jgi:two-component system OmpR family sensor kinase
VTVEERLATRAWRRIWWQTSVVVGLAILAVAGAATGVVLTAQATTARHTVADALQNGLADTGVPPPAGVWVYQMRDGALTHTPGAPEQPIDPAGLGAVASAPADTAGGHPHESTLGPREFLVDTARSGSTTVQVAYDLTVQEQERHRLYDALALACALGLALAAGTGALIARRAIQPLSLAVARQQRFVADASHELRTPITQLHTRAQLLARSLAGQDSEAAQDARRLVRSTRLLGDIVEEMLLSAQLRSEPAQFGPVDLTRLATGVVDDHRDRASEQGATLAVETDPGPHTVRGVPGALRRAIASLVDNALGHVNAGGTVVVALWRGQGQVVCVVNDDGVGFDPADADRIFERFARGAHGEGRRFGLGLALVRETVEAHGGTVTAESIPGRGATFSMRFPAFDPQPGDSPGHSLL